MGTHHSKAQNCAWLEKRSFNITKELAYLIKTFEDFRLVAQIRKEIEKVKPSLAFTAVTEK